ncbi:TlpA disulfide reductase family protein [Pedobacter nyackensis]|uniref:Thiol-disulfide isomerase or thioredoxin n=1 Tax=Pedobacter nyackensis TaxID=475255 RepID=A0A1W2DKG3_9SPHI|nr:TlpA disulfide reductase family protein [Pedobacter nyackensis]SMC97965.1 Thiol-disulfide isomerase or thioredoxin [Pedobacter nyackensis]
MNHFFKSGTVALLTVVALSLSNAYAQNAPVAKRPERPPITLKVGDAAPAIVAEKWIKGKPITKFEQGRVYVMEFWATWCGPCRASMPHLSEVARKYKKDADVISFNVKELIAGKNKNGDYITKVERFVSRLGDGMDYIVAADVREDVMWNTWLVASGRFGIPVAYIIDQTGKIAWIGHPASVEDPLEMVIAGTYNEEGKAKLALKVKELEAQSKALNEALKTAEDAKDYKKALQLVDQLMPMSPFGVGSLAGKKYKLLEQIDVKKAHAYALEAMKIYENDPLTLQSVSEEISDYKLALKLMEKAATKCDSEDPYAVADLAKAYYKAGDTKKAIETQQRVIDILNDTSLVEQKQQVKDAAQETMKIYKTGGKLPNS